MKLKPSQPPLSTSASDTLSALRVKTLLSSHDIYPQKQLGQNFLVTPKALSRVIEASAITPEDTVVEVGPGLGALTQELAKKAKRVIAIEKDARLIPILKEMFSASPNVEIIHGDILSLPESSMPRSLGLEDRSGLSTFYFL
ncbi:MAG: rRNA adenine N-6-methyltransferase family protein, partial [bacterium]|nr:rRNA adenine N-6-methyltransferase family protein [bacterium]